MNVLHISVRADFGGGPEHVFQQAQDQLKEHNIGVYLACPEDYPYFSRYSSLVSPDKIFSIPHRKFDFTRLCRLVSFVRRNKIDVIHSHGKGAGLYGRLLCLVTGIPCVHTFHGLHVGEYSNFKKRIYILLERLLGLLTRYVICVSNGELNSIEAERIVNANKLIQIDNGVNVPDSTPKRAPKPLVNILAVNRYDDQKNPELLINISDAIKSSKLYGVVKILVIGDGDRFSVINKSVDKKSLHDVIKLYGPTPEPRAFMKEADVFLTTSRWEGMPLAVLEAMSEGLPVLATKVVGNIDVMEDMVQGVFYNDDDAKSALDAIEKMIDPEFRSKCSHAAYRHVLDNYSVSKMVKETVNIYRKLNNRK